MRTDKAVITVQNVKTELGNTCVHKDVSLSIYKGEIFAIVGGSGSGKTTLMREMLSLTKVTAGSIKVFDKEITTASRETLRKLQRRFGVLFQQNALFSSLTLLENVGFPLKEHTNLDHQTIDQLALLKIHMAGLPTEAANKYPAELSGGMQKRAGIARALILDPEILFLDEPTAGLDPDTAAGFDALILNLQSTIGLTIVMVTHDLDSLWTLTNRVAFLGDGKVLGLAPMSELIKLPNDDIQHFFNGPRGRSVKQASPPPKDEST